MDLDKIPAELGLAQAWEKRSTGWWLAAPDLDVEGMARGLSARGARFVTITARPASGGECRMDYHWDIAGQLLTFVTHTHAGSIVSIASLCPAADWVEREVHDYFAVDFLGRPATDPLMLRTGDPPGVFRPEGSPTGRPDSRRNGGPPA